MRQTLTDLIRSALLQLQREGLLPADAPLEFKPDRPKEKQHGDFAVNAALVLAKPARMKPRDLAERIVAALPPGQRDVERCEIAGPGFINFFMTRDRMRRLIPEILTAGSQWGRSPAGAGRRVQVEFVSANPTGPMHVGHGRGAAMGDVIARLLAACGFQVEKEYYVNDAGAQVKVLGRSILLRYREGFGYPVAMPEECYPGDYVKDWAVTLRNRDGDRWLEASAHATDPSLEPPPEVVEFAIAQALDEIRRDLASLDIHFDSWFSERNLHEQGGIDQAVTLLAQRDLIYEGVLEPPKGKLPEDWEARPQTLFRATRFGDEVDRPLQKSDGSYTYFAADIAYHLNKAQRGFDALINVWGADHGGYVKRVQAALEALTGKTGLLDVKLVQMVNLTRGGKPVRMSKRAGTFVTLREVVEETGSDAVRFWFLTRAGTSQLDFDLELAVSRSYDNPVYYVQYAHARVHSLWRQLKEKGWDLPRETLPGADLSPLEQDEEMGLLRLLGRYPETVEGAALSHEPHHVTYYLLELAAAFHGYYNGCRILEEDSARRTARLALCDAVRQVIANGLALLGVSAPERM
ncbi:MAG: arginine--tRNA ligase [Magnetococcales bacterium]|nr:arginine--tRNA ligase [Magnetococcales bacterium]